MFDPVAATASLPEPLWRDVLGDRLRQLRRERGETLGEVAKRAGMSPQYLSEIERGIKEPSSEMIAAVAGALDLALVDLTIAVSERLIASRDIEVRAPSVLRGTQRLSTMGMPAMALAA